MALPARTPLRPGAPRAPRLLLVGLLAMVPPLLLADLLHRSTAAPQHRSTDTLLQHDRWDTDLDRSVIEALGYLQMAVASALLLVLAVRRRTLLWGACGAVLATAMLDDYVQGHERFGASWARRTSLPSPLGLREQDVGELLFWVALGVGGAVALALGWRRAAAGERLASLRLLAVLGVLAVFAVVVDVVHIALPLTDGSAADVAVIWSEAAGEAGTMSVFLVLSLQLLLQDRAPGDPGPGAG